MIIHFLYKKKKFDGQIFLMYVSWYGFGRMFIEGLRTDSLYVGVFRISQVIGFVCFVVGTTLLIINLVKARRRELDAQEYVRTYSAPHDIVVDSVKDEVNTDSEERVDITDKIDRIFNTDDTQGENE